MSMRTALVALLCLTAATPPGWFPGAGLLVLPGLAAMYAVTTSARHPYRLLYAIGVLHLLAFSWSLRHVFEAAPMLIALVGGLYYLLAAAWTRALLRWLPGALAFACAIAGTQWLRAVMPEVPYPHGQPVHALYRWPVLLGSLAWGGEALGNALLAALGAAAVDLWRAWRSARPQWARARRFAIASAATAAVATIVPAPTARAPAAAAPIRVAAVQPNLAPEYQFGAEFARVVEARLVAPTLRIAGPQAEAPPALVLWPETSYPPVLDARSDLPRFSHRVRVDLAPSTRLVAGTLGLFPGGRTTPIAVMVDGQGRLLAYSEKLELVPAGEFLPFVGWLPDAASDWLRAFIERRMGGVPHFAPGQKAHPMSTESGARFGAMLCYDNAFPRVARDLVAAGAVFLVVLSNEAWYHGGAELDQLEAMSVCRAVENATPIVRCTADGATLAIDRAGRVLRRLPHGTGRGAAEVLEAEITPGPGALRPLAWLHDLVCWLAFVSLAPLARHALQSWARLLRSRSGRGRNPVVA
jgi:apolipoprotein N-acyltransferase